MNASISWMHAGLAAVLGALICASCAWAEPNGIDFAAYFDSDIRDAEECAMGVGEGVLAIDSAITVGAPQKDWFYGSASRPEVKAFQSDFMWGMPFFAHP